ncbi:MAG: DUF262 domain-containing protein [Fimbriimonadaceae bacterium]
MDELVNEIDAATANIRTEPLDLTVGELLNLHREGELIIKPDYQRLFRWSVGQRSRLIESLLVGLPIPQIFMFQADDGVLELVDGLQRVSSLIHFIDQTLLAEEVRAKPPNDQPLTLDECDLLENLNGLTYKELPKLLQLELKRKPMRAVVIKRTNEQEVRYQMFKRLNAGGEEATRQEIRNATVRILGQPGIEFLQFLEECATQPRFVECTQTIPDATAATLGLHELVLRYLAVKNFRGSFKGSIADWLDAYIEAILINGEPFERLNEWNTFVELFEALAEKLGAGAFVKYRDSKPVGALAPAYFEAVTMGALGSLDSFKALTPEAAVQRLADTVSGDEFRAVTGPGANSLPKLNERIRLIQVAFA